MFEMIIIHKTEVIYIFSNFKSLNLTIFCSLVLLFFFRKTFLRYWFYFGRYVRVCWLTIFSNMLNSRRLWQTPLVEYCNSIQFKHFGFSKYIDTIVSFNYLAIISTSAVLNCNKLHFELFKTALTYQSSRKVNNTKVKMPRNFSFFPSGIYKLFPYLIFKFNPCTFDAHFSTLRNNITPLFEFNARGLNVVDEQFLVVTCHGWQLY